MAWNPSPHVADCRDIARRWNCTQVVILAINTRSGRVETTSYGETPHLCDEAGKLCDLIFDLVTKPAPKSVELSCRHCGKLINDCTCSRVVADEGR